MKGTLGTVLLLFAGLLCTWAVGDEEWLSWKQKYSKVYGSLQEEANAHAIWLRHMDFIQSHNSRSDVSFTLEMNEFGDQDFTARPHKPNRLLHSLRYVPEVTNNFLPRAPPTSFDWRTRGVISSVRNQGMLGSSDAYSVVEDLESLHAIKTGQLVSLSVAEVVDCCSLTRGMLVDGIYECIAKHGGLCSEQSYPPSSSSACRNNSCRAAVNDANTTVFIPHGDEARMLTAVLERPLVVFIDASRPSFQMYKAGVYEDAGCSGKQLDHALQLVGYGQDSAGKPYWILKNTWGVDWGNQGYVWLRRGVNMCGVADNAFYPQ